MSDKNRQGRTYIAANIKRESVVIDAKGNEMTKEEFEKQIKAGTYSKHQDAKE